MVRTDVAALSTACFVALALGCGTDEASSSAGQGGATSATTTSSASSGGASARCSGALQILQKDAYRSSAGRSTELWPPHTTTVLSYSCDDGSEASSFQANHGTEPDDQDADGQTILVETGRIEIEGDAVELAALAAAYDACACDTTFLTLDALEDEAVQQLVEVLSGYVVDHLSCSGSVDAEGLVALLQAGDIEAVVAELPNCSWAAGESWQEGFDEALASFIADAMETLSDYHVCNNDALLQDQLIREWASSGTLLACDGDASVCHGPAWFYTPQP